jgi:hypothetical protein
MWRLPHAGYNRLTDGSSLLEGRSNPGPRAAGRVTILLLVQQLDQPCQGVSQGTFATQTGRPAALAVFELGPHRMEVMAASLQQRSIYSTGWTTEELGFYF